jgi:hypothetical protein
MVGGVCSFRVFHDGLLVARYWSKRLRMMVRDGMDSGGQHLLPVSVQSSRSECPGRVIVPPRLDRSRCLTFQSLVLLASVRFSTTSYSTED